MILNENASINSFDHNIENEENLAEPLYVQNQTTQGKQFSSYQDSLQIINTEKNTFQNPQRRELEGKNDQPSFQIQHYQIPQFKTLIQNQSNQNFIPSSPSKYSNFSNLNQNQRRSTQMNMTENIESLFGQKQNPVETKEINSNEDQITIKRKKEKIQCKCIKILIVDDNTFNVYALKQLIKTLKQKESDTALSGEQAIELIKDKQNNQCCQQYKIIFMDIDMPSQNGFQTTSQIRKKFLSYKNTMIIGCSGYSNTPQEYQNCIESGMNDYLAKPIDKKHLKQMLESYYD